MHERIGHGESAEMYLKSIHELRGDDGVAPISGLASRLGITVVSATEMVHRMEAQGLVEHLPYRGVALTRDGQLSAVSILRRQRLWECFLFEHLGLPWERLYDLACQLEHAAGPEVTERLAEHLGHPSLCPHGNPIPDAAGEMVPGKGIPLSSLETGASAIIRRVASIGSPALAYLAENGLIPGAGFTLENLEPVDGLRTLRTERGRAVVGSQIAEQIFVEPATR